MMAALIRLVALLAFVLMPLGMGPAAAAPPNVPMAVTAGHCDEHPAPAKGKATHGMDCAAACSMLMAEAARVDAPAPMAPVAAEPAGYTPIDGLHPEAATPPPKIA